MTKKNLKKLALDIKSGLVFTSWQVTNKEVLPRIFMPIALGGFKKSWVFFYSYFEHQLNHPRSICGYPLFSTVGGLNKKDMLELHKILCHLEEKEKEAINEY
jgi:hypothetical protein